VDAMYLASAEVLIAATQLGSGVELPPPERLREDLLKLLRQMVAKCRAAGIADGETAEARYALVAFLDERILRSNWVGRAEWMNNPLQLQLYREYAAGENFFARMRAIQQRDRHAPALEVYHLCLALGFTGAMQAEAQHNAQSHLEATRDCVPRLPPNAPLSAHGVPPDHYAAAKPRRPLVLFLSIGCFVVVALGVGLLSWSLSDAIDGARRGLIRPASPAAVLPR
jgi:type VI secretion system protein ImpK